MLYVFYSIHMIAYSGGAPIQSSLRRPSGSNKALVLSESSDISLTVLNREKSNGIRKHRGFYLRYFACKWFSGLKRSFRKLKYPVDSNSAKKISLRFKKSFKNPKLSGTWRKVILGISGKTWQGKTATDRHDRQTRTSHQRTAVRASIDLPIRNRKTETGMKRIWGILNL